MASSGLEELMKPCTITCCQSSQDKTFSTDLLETSEPYISMAASVSSVLDTGEREWPSGRLLAAEGE